MSLVINHNMMAMNTARNLNNTYGRLNKSVERLSSGLRINSAADDAAGLAIRELMRADITTMQQGVRNAADAISMIQTADGGMAVIDEKLTRMKELAEQAATGTYTTLQREIINSEYQAMAAEIDRIASATNFNGVKLLDGSITNLHGGLGMKIHFGTGNSANEDYYFINTGDVRATSSSGLQIGGDAKNDIWGQGAAGAKGLAGPGCCTAGYDSLNGNAGFTSGETFSYGYNWDWMEDDDEDLLSGKYLAGRYVVGSSWSLQDLVDEVNRGTQSRVGVQIDSSALAAAIKSGGTTAVCVGEEAYIFGSTSVAGGKYFIPASAGSPGYEANASYTNGTLQFNRLNLFALSASARAALTAAGVNLSLLGLNSAAAVTASGSSIDPVNAQMLASASLQANLVAAWTALGLGSFNGITVDPAQYNTGFTSPVLNDISNSAGNSLTDTTGQAMVKPGETFIVHTGIYVDASGNWTSAKAIASALQMTEIVYSFTNNNTSEYTYTANINYTSASYFVSAGAGVAFTEANRLALEAAGVNIAQPSYMTHPQVKASAGSNASLTVAENAAIADANAAWNAIFSTTTLNSARLTAANGATAATLVTQSVLWASAGGTAHINDTVSANMTISAHTGVYIDNNGNFTDDADLAKLFGMEEVSFTLTNPGTAPDDLSIDMYVGNTKLSTTTGLADNNGLQWYQSVMFTALTQEINTRQGANGAITGEGQITKVTFDPPGTLTAANLGTSLTTHTANPLEVKVNGQIISTFDGLPNTTVSNIVSWLAGTVPAGTITDIRGSIADFLANGRLGTTQGRLEISSPIQQPDAPGDSTTWSGYSNLPGTIGANTEQTVATKGIIDSTKYAHLVATSATPLEDASGRSNFGAWALATAINHNERSEFWAMYEVVNVNGVSAEMCYIFTKKGGDFNSLTACDVGDGDLDSQNALKAITFENLESGNRTEDGTTFSLGGQHWGSLKPIQTKAGYGNEVWNLTIDGRDVGRDRDLWIAGVSNGENEITTPGLSSDIINGLDRHSFVEIQNAADGEWAGAEVRTQSSAQEALDAVNKAMERKDKVRADIGALQNRLENTITNLEIQIEALQASESRISDVDVATEMTEFVRNQVLAQAAVSMLSQANSLPQLALALLHGYCGPLGAYPRQVRSA
jgi:flagellin-like hook-associated protein FlgL